MTHNNSIKPIKIPINEESKPKASAWYRATYDHLEEDNKIILLFPLGCIGYIISNP